VEDHTTGRPGLIRDATARSIGRMTETQQHVSQPARVPFTARVLPTTDQALAQFAYDLSAPGAQLSKGAAGEVLIEAAFTGLSSGALTIAHFPPALAGKLTTLVLSRRLVVPEHLRATGAVPPVETPEEKAKREAEEAKQPAPGPLGGPRHGKPLPVGEGPRGPKKASRR